MGGTGRPLGKTFFLQCQRRHPELPKIPTYLPHTSWYLFSFAARARHPLGEFGTGKRSLWQVFVLPLTGWCIDIIHLLTCNNLEQLCIRRLLINKSFRIILAFFVIPQYRQQHVALHVLGVRGPHMETQILDLLLHELASLEFHSVMVFLTNDKKLTLEKDMVLLGIGTQTHIIDVGLYLCPSGNQLLYKRSASQYVQNFVHRFLEECRGVGYPKRHDLPFKHTTLRGYKGQTFLSCGG